MATPCQALVTCTRADALLSVQPCDCPPCPQHPLDAHVDPDEPLRCPLCGAKQKSPEKLAKHFQQLHQREHSKRVRNNPKAKKYLKSDKAQR